MAWEYPILDQPGALAGSDFSTSANGYQSTGQFLIVKADPAHVGGTYVYISSHRDKPSGIAQNNPKLGGALQMRRLGISKVVCGATLVAGQSYGPNNSGQAVNKMETSTGADYGDYVLGEVIEGGGVGELATVMVYGPYRI